MAITSKDKMRLMKVSVIIISIIVLLIVLPVLFITMSKTRKGFSARSMERIVSPDESLIADAYVIDRILYIVLRDKDNRILDILDTKAAATLLWHGWKLTWHGNSSIQLDTSDLGKIDISIVRNRMQAHPANDSWFAEAYLHDIGIDLKDASDPIYFGQENMFSWILYSDSPLSFPDYAIKKNISSSSAYLPRLGYPLELLRFQIKDPGFSFPTTADSLITVYCWNNSSQEIYVEKWHSKEGYLWFIQAKNGD